MLVVSVCLCIRAVHAERALHMQSAYRSASSNFVWLICSLHRCLSWTFQEDASCKGRTQHSTLVLCSICVSRIRNIKWSKYSLDMYVLRLILSAPSNMTTYCCFCRQLWIWLKARRTTSCTWDSFSIASKANWLVSEKLYWTKWPAAAWSTWIMWVRSCQNWLGAQRNWNRTALRSTALILSFVLPIMLG